VHADGRTLVVEQARDHRDRFLVKFEGIEGREAAEGLRGALYVPADRKRALEESEYWADDLVGLKVVLTDGAEVGTAREVLAGTAHDLLVVETERGERMIPMVKEIVTKVDVDGGSIEVSPPEGLLE
jgi:16S rRNA processing protein RimM